MRCGKVELSFSEFLKEELPTGLQAKVAEHIESCAACRKSYTEFKALMGRLEEWKMPPPREDYFWQMLPQRIAAQVPPPSRERKWSLIPALTARPRMAWAAALALIVALGIWIYPSLTPERPLVAVKTAAVTTETQSPLFSFNGEDIYQHNQWLETVKTVDKMNPQETGRVGEAMSASLTLDNSLNQVPSDLLLNEGSHMINLYKDVMDLQQPDLHNVIAYLDSDENYGH